MKSRIAQFAAGIALVAALSGTRVWAQVQLKVTEVRPAEVEAGTPVTILGQGFSSRTEIRFGGHLLVDATYSAFTASITGKAPPLGATEPAGPKDVQAKDGLQTSTLANGVTYAAPPPPPAPVLEKVEPSLVSTKGGATIALIGKSFTARHFPRIDGVRMSGFELISSTRIELSTPALSEGFHDVGIASLDDPAIDVTLPDSLEAAPPIVVTSVEPKDVWPGVNVTVRGENFRAQTAVRFSQTPIENLQLISPTEIRGRAPSLSGEPSLGTKNVRASDTRNSYTLEGGVRYVEKPSIPGPQQVETSLAEGTARFSWYNPVAYTEIEVLDPAGNVIQRLPGTATSIELGAAGADSVPVVLRGRIADTVSEDIDVIAKWFWCNPLPLAGDSTPGDIELAIRGGHAEATVERCAGGGSDPTGGHDHHHVHAGDGAAHAADRNEHGGHHKIVANPADRLGTGGWTLPGGIGGMIPEWVLSSFGKPSSLITGFLLEEDAAILEFSGFYEKVAPFPGLELRARITQVASPDDPDLENGFTDELTFPNVVSARDKDWHSVTYFRANKDVGYVPNPNDPNDGPAEPCLDEEGKLLRIPRGEYLLEIYAVGGDPDVQYFAFANDSRDFELLIPGVPCPPYPLVRVRNMTGRKTLPAIQRIEVETLSELPKPFIKLTAFGTWLDEQEMLHEVGPGGEPDSPDFEYIWTIHDKGGNPTTISSGSASSLSTVVQDFGCYHVDLEVRDKGCGRSIQSTFEIAVTPQIVQCRAGNPYFSILFPKPDPSGVHALAGLKPEPGQGTFENERVVEFSVLVAPRYICEGKFGSSVFIGDGSDPDIEFTLAVLGKQNGVYQYIPIPGATPEILDLCPDVLEGHKYIHIRFPDLGSIPEIPGTSGKRFRSVHLVSRTRKFYFGPGNDERAPVSPTDSWRHFGAFRMGNHPPVLDRSYWTGYWDEEDGTYYFEVQASKNTRESFPFGATKEVPLPLDDAPVDISIPSFKNDLTAGFNARFALHGEEYFAVDGSGGAFGEAFGNALESQPLVIPESSAGATIHAAQADGGAHALPEYHWEECKVLFRNRLEQTLFESILFTGSIGPVPVTVWASIGIGIDLALESITKVAVRPFELGGSSGLPAVQSDFFLLGKVGVSVPCEIRADVLFGIASVAARLIPQAEVVMNAHVGIRNLDPDIGAYVGAFLSLFFEVEACIWAVFTEVCYSPGKVKILDREPLIEKTIRDGVPPATPCERTLEAVAALIAVPEDERVPMPELAGGEGGGQGVDPTFELMASSRNSIAISEDGDTTLYTYSVKDAFNSFDASTLGVALTNHDSIFQTEQVIRDVVDPAAAFVTSSRALVVWTRGGLPPYPIPAFGIQRNNAIAAYQDILVTPMREVSQAVWRHDGESSFFLAADDPESTPANGSRADGMAVIAADPSAQAKQAGGEALVAWVRYEGSFLVDDGTSKTTWLATTRFQDGRLKPWFAAEDKPSIRPALEHTAIYARRIGFSGPIDEKVRISPAGVGINVEPTIAVSPSGNTAVCVWVHDSFVDPQTGKQHVNLVDSNLGRELLYAVYDKATGEWSDAEPVLANPDAFPGLLEPHIAMSGDDDGLLAFTALRSDASTFDTGLVNGRHVFAVRLVDGEFGAPVLIHGKCLTPESGHWPTVAWSAPRNPVPIGGFFTDPPEFTIVYHGVGASGARAGAGNLLATTISAGAESFIAPIRLASDDAIHSNVSFAMAPTGEIRTLHMNGGFSEWEPGSIAGDPAARALQQKTTPIEPDAAITACRLSDSYPAPGSRITASIDVENLGLAATAREANGDSALGVVAIFIDAEGNERAVGEAPLGVLAPGETATVEIELEMPHDPVLLRVELSPNPIDRDPENDARECPFGTPAPTDVACSFAFYPTGEIDEETDAELTRGVARITWRNAAAYDEIWIYRDGSMLTALSGRATVFVDSFTSPGEHVYQVRARIGPSHSLRATCEVEIPADAPVVSGPTFRRGDVNGDGGFDISDPIAELAYLFAGGTTPGCLDAADANDDASVDISDAVYGLGYLFLGGPKPPAPFDECGEDPTDDAYECESYEACEGGF